MVRDPSFAVRTSDGIDAGETLLLGLADSGAASLTALDYLATTLEATRIGHLEVENLPVVAPVTDGSVRHPIRLYAVDETPITLLVSELFIPVGAATSFVDAIGDWVRANGIDEIAAIHGAPFPHSEDEHLVFYAGSEFWQRTRFGDRADRETASIEPLPGGVLDGVNAELLVRGLEASHPATGVFVTPSHPPDPDLDAALRLLGGLEACYSIDVDERELRRRFEEVTQYYEALASRLTALQQGENSLEDREFPADRMYM
ncbi:proteasome assembly chaperone family protein [Natronorubrum sp. DTA7]|uniref:proteasome assembly chaperone family protein n=1 Tax=Natronorubrum sp. DTA7 TaxID=3447016 RepID=UPI003F849DFB